MWCPIHPLLIYMCNLLYSYKCMCSSAYFYFRSEGKSLFTFFITLIMSLCYHKEGLLYCQYVVHFWLLLKLVSLCHLKIWIHCYGIVYSSYITLSVLYTSPFINNDLFSVCIQFGCKWVGTFWIKFHVPFLYSYVIQL